METVQTQNEYTNKEMLDSFLDIVRESSDNSAKQYERGILIFKKFLNGKNLLEAKPKDGDAFIKFWNRPDKTGYPKYSYNYRKTQLLYVFKFYKHVVDRFRRSEVMFFNPFPNDLVKHITTDKPLTDKQQLKKNENSYYKYEGLRRIFRRTEKGDIRFHYISVIMFSTGMRLSEAVSIRVENLNSRERYVLVGTDKNHRKTSKDGTPLTFCFSPRVAILLDQYMRYHKKFYSHSKWLFPSRINSSDKPEAKDRYVSTRSMQKYYNTLNLGFPIRSHSFRRSLAVYRQEMKIPLHKSEALSCHAISSVEMRSYANVGYTIEKRREDFDEYYTDMYKKVERYLN